jgi:chromosome partitioning protein
MIPTLPSPTAPCIIALTSNKGGTGKTTLALGLSAGLARKGYRVLMIDMDQQANLSSGAGIDDATLHIGLLLRGINTFSQVLIKGTSTQADQAESRPTDRSPAEYRPDGFGALDLLPASADLTTHQRLLDVEPGGEFVLREILDEHAQDYDFVFIDCPPNLGIMTFMSLTAATHYIVPIQGENFAYKGLDSIRNCVAQVRKRFNKDLSMAGIVLNKFRVNTSFGQQVLQLLDSTPDMYRFQTLIRQNVALMECTAEGRSIYDYDPKSTGASDFDALCTELLSRVGRG